MQILWPFLGHHHFSFNFLASPLHLTVNTCIFLGLFVSLSYPHPSHGCSSRADFRNLLFHLHSCFSSYPYADDIISMLRCFSHLSSHFSKCPLDIFSCAIVTAKSNQCKTDPGFSHASNTGFFPLVTVFIMAHSTTFSPAESDGTRF